MKNNSSHKIERKTPNHKNLAKKRKEVATKKKKKMMDKTNIVNGIKKK